MSLPRTIADATTALERGDISSVELVTALLDRADAIDRTLGSYLTRFDESALDAATRADAARAAGRATGPVHGIPVALKDNVMAREGPTTAQSLAVDPGLGLGRDAAVTARLREAGAIVMGKTTLSEFAMGAVDHDAPFPVPRNPWDLSRGPGGSSSGSGSGVAAGLFLGAVGTDTGGSVRLPAHFNGVTALRPTFGLVPVEGIVPLAHTFDCAGPMARTVRDCARMLTAMSGRHADYEATLTGSLAGARIGVARPHRAPMQVVNDDIDHAFERAVDDLAAGGALLRDVALPLLREACDAYCMAYVVEGLAYHQRRARERWTQYGTLTRLSLAHASLYSGNDYLQAQRVCRLVFEALVDVFRDVDVIVLPTAAAPASGFGGPLPDGWLTTHLPIRYYTFAVSAARLPAASVPMGFTTDGLPVGLQIVGRPADDETILRIADAYQARTGWDLGEPPLTGVPAEPRPLDTRPGDLADPADETAVRAAVARVGLPASDEEVTVVARSHPYAREAADRVCAAGAASDRAPILRFER